MRNEFDVTELNVEPSAVSDIYFGYDMNKYRVRDRSDNCYCFSGKVMFNTSNAYDKLKEALGIDGKDLFGRDPSRISKIYHNPKKRTTVVVFDYTPRVIPENDRWIVLEEQNSIFDTECRNCYAQYGNKSETPMKKWDDVDTSKLHYVMLPQHHIVIDFDLKDANGNKSLEFNLKEANKWPKTYVEVSKGGQGLHLHYYYHVLSGDICERKVKVKLDENDPDNIYMAVASAVSIYKYGTNSQFKAHIRKSVDADIYGAATGDLYLITAQFEASSIFGSWKEFKKVVDEKLHISEKKEVKK